MAAPVSARAPYVGQRVARVEDRRLLTGTGRFVADVRCEDQLYAHIVRSHVAHGELRRVDTAAAARRPGVVRVVTADDLAQVTVPVRLLPSEASGLSEQPVLARGVVRYVGEPIAVIVATDPYLAEDAAEHVDIEVESLPPVVDLARALEPTAPVLHTALGTNAVDRAVMRHGEDVEALFEAAPVTLSETFAVQRHGSVPMETRGLVAACDEDGQRLTVWGVAKVKHFNRILLGRLLERPVDDIRFVECDVGGGFGARGEFYPEDYLIPWLCLALRRPVKWIEDRHESLTTMNQSREQEWRFELAAEEDGTLLAFRATAHFDQGAYARTHGTSLLPKIMLNHIAGPYRWGGFAADATSVFTNKTPAGTYRGPCQYEPTFVRERMLDLLAARLSLEPAELRARNLIRRADLPYTTGFLDYVTGAPIVVRHADYPRVWQALMETAGYGELRAEVEARRHAGERVGIGLSTFVEIGAPGAFEQARAVAEPDGTFTVHVGIGSVGQGVETSLAQVAADTLGVELARVRISYQDTDEVPEGLGAFSSRTTVFGGNAIAGAAQALRRRAVAVAAERLGVDEDVLEASDGMVQRPDGAPIAFSELDVCADFRYEPEPGAEVVMGANLALVSIAPVTQDPVVQRCVVAYDVGRIVNPLTLEGQIKGGVVQGVGGALFEEFRYDAEGQPLSTTFMDYLLPTAAEAPEIEVALLELGVASAHNPLGAKGGAEGGIVGIGAAVANAVADALQGTPAHIASLPVRPGPLWEQLTPPATAS